MINTLQASSEIEAVDLLRVQLESLTLEELMDHRTKVHNTLMALVHVKVQADWLSVNAAANITRLAKKLHVHLVRLLEMIEALQVESTMAAAESNEGCCGNACSCGQGVAFSRLRLKH